MLDSNIIIFFVKTPKIVKDKPKKVETFSGNQQSTSNRANTKQH